MLNLNNFLQQLLPREQLKMALAHRQKSWVVSCMLVFIRLLASLNLNDFLQQALAEEKTMTSDLITRQASFMIFFICLVGCSNLKILLQQVVMRTHAKLISALEMAILMVCFSAMFRRFFSFI
jgi:hypothetical protein